MKRIYIFIVLLTLSLTAVFAQKSYLPYIDFTPETSKSGNDFNISVEVNMNRLILESKDRVALTLFLQSTEGKTKMEFKLADIVGAKKAKSVRRAIHLGTYKGNTKASDLYVRDNRSLQTTHFHFSVPYEDWMKKAELYVVEQVTACSDCNKGYHTRLLSSKLLPDEFVPNYRLTYVTPQAEPIKQRSEKYEAFLNFEVGKADILPAFENNATELEKVNRTIQQVQNDSNLTVTHLAIAGFASPEGSRKMNEELSQKRAESFAQYLSEKYDIDLENFEVSWSGEDWDGLVNAIQQSAVQDRDTVLAIIHEEEDWDVREARIKRLSEGTTYRILLHEFYPSLRRNEYTIAYVARPFDVNEAREIIKSQPQLLSLNEMFLVSQTYEKGSREFKNVFDVAARMFPDDPIANLNAATVELESGNVDGAIARLQKVQNMPEAWNNLGVALVSKKKYKEALGYFDRAANRGNTTAKINAEQLRLFLSNQ